MTPFPWFDFSVLVALILINGVFAMSELAIVSARQAQLRMEAEKGSGAARTALSLAQDPGKFLSTVQIGITLIGIIAGAYSGATLGGPVGERLEAMGLPADTAETAGFVSVIVLTTYLSLVIGELVPKQVALRAALPIALAMARPMAMLARIAAPFVWVLDKSSSLLMRLLGIRHKGEHGLTAQELQMIFADATRSGAIEEEERAILSGVMRLNTRPVRELMTPRTELDWIDASATAEEFRALISESPHSLIPVGQGTADKMLGVVKVREVLAELLDGKPLDLPAMVTKTEVVPDQLDAMDALRILQSSGAGIAMVHDEYGHLDGIVTSADLLSAIAGSFASHADEGDEPMVVERADGSLLISGAMGADDLADRLGIELPEAREFATAAGFVLFYLKKLPEEGEWFEEQAYRFEVVDMDGRRIDKLLVSGVS
ncbi:hemolysin family protein [Paraurantiacibacter namhicola]|uniref:Magnesium and cobalt efflux protein CorC n=1 Tax=Paraurantiacibacter namhicola TaxID=645517 RepID=A0A1C7D5D6_9SPHN|nr:hemolysin family protein [Paraurantiacibacter namhicola]ANU06675.1 Magnesium and cobalt efflux protein CorC [Paraurantiacibacter namhicola]